MIGYRDAYDKRALPAQPLRVQEISGVSSGEELNLSPRIDTGICIADIRSFLKTRYWDPLRKFEARSTDTATTVMHVSKGRTF